MQDGVDPRICNITIDANALDRDGSARDSLVDRFLNLRQAGKIKRVVVPGSVRDEIQHPSTPHDVKSVVLPEIFSIGVSRTVAEYDSLRKVRAILRGNSAPGKHDDDALHICEAAQKCGGGYFITHDRRILKKRDEIRHGLGLQGGAFRIVTVAEFLDIYDHFVALRPR